MIINLVEMKVPEESGWMGMKGVSPSDTKVTTKLMVASEESLRVSVPWDGGEKRAVCESGKVCKDEREREEIREGICVESVWWRRGREEGETG